jgi:hypothetical protein
MDRTLNTKAARAAAGAAAKAAKKKEALNADKRESDRRIAKLKKLNKDGFIVIQSFASKREVKKMRKETSWEDDRNKPNLTPPQQQQYDSLRNVDPAGGLTDVNRRFFMIYPALLAINIMRRLYDACGCCGAWTHFPESPVALHSMQVGALRETLTEPPGKSPKK